MATRRATSICPHSAALVLASSMAAWAQAALTVAVPVRQEVVAAAAAAAVAVNQTKS